MFFAIVGGSLLFCSDSTDDCFDFWRRFFMLFVLLVLFILFVFVDDGGLWILWIL